LCNRWGWDSFAETSKTERATKVKNNKKNKVKSPRLRRGLLDAKIREREVFNVFDSSLLHLNSGVTIRLRIGRNQARARRASR
jgi:hypothetical protein